LPHLAKLLGQEAVKRRREELERLGSALLWQTERDLALVSRHVPAEEIYRSYKDVLGNPGQFVHAAYEIRVAAMLAPVAKQLRLSLAVGQKQCDASGVIGGQQVHFEVTTIEDIFPWDRGAWEKGEDVLEPRSRATMTQPFRPPPASPLTADVMVPESEDIRKKVKHKLAQLPHEGAGIVVIGTRHGRSLDIEAALYGDEILRSGHGSPPWGVRTANGLFAIPDEQGGTSKLTAAIWIKLAPHFADVRTHSRLFLNSRAIRPLTVGAADLLLTAFDRRAVLCQELERVKGILVEHYRPDRIILFGSLADASPDHVHEWSDIDLFIVKSTGAGFFQRSREVVDLIAPRVGVNVIVYTPEELARSEQEGQFFIKAEILGRGRVLYP
jgi:predicted nucleotidyltransferase